MANSAEVLSHQYPVVLFCVHHLACYRGIKAAEDRITEHKEFWASTGSGHLKLATIARRL